MPGKLVKFLKCIFLLPIIAEASIPDSPCPEIFNYEQFEDNWFGKIRLDNVKMGHLVNIYVELSVPIFLPRSNRGSLDLFDDLQQTTQAIYQHKPLLYKIIFPVQDPIPSIAKITTNNQIICIGHPDIDNTLEATKIELYHNFYTRVKPEDSNDASIGLLTSYKHPIKIVQNEIKIIHFTTSSTQPPKTTTEAETTTVTPPALTSRFLIDEPVKIIRPPQQINAICGHPVSNEKTLFAVNGNLHENGDCPWLAAIFIVKGNDLNFECGGTLITAELTLTAAHCFLKEGQIEAVSPRKVFTALGRHDIHQWVESGSLFLPTERIEFPPDFYKSDSFEVDIAIVRHAKTISFPDYSNIRPICMWSGSYNFSQIEGHTGTVAGWGRQKSGNELSPEPKKIDVGIISRETCIQNNSKLEAITTRTNFCAGEKNGRGPCIADSGSGLYIYNNDRWELRGIVAGTIHGDVKRTYGLCQLDEYVVYVDVLQFEDWLRNLII